MTPTHRRECRCKGRGRDGQARGWRKGIITYRARGETLTFEECKNYRGVGAERKAGGLINQTEGCECWSQCSGKPLEGHARKLSDDAIRFALEEDHRGYVGEQGWWQGVQAGSHGLHQAKDDGDLRERRGR